MLGSPFDHLSHYNLSGSGVLRGVPTGLRYLIPEISIYLGNYLKLLVDIRDSGLTFWHKTAEDVDLFIDIATGSILPYIQYFQGPYNKPLTGGAIGSQISGYQSYSDAKQIQGYLGSLRGAPEYEKLLEVPGPATASMDAQSAAHLLIAVLIAVNSDGQARGNVCLAVSY
jgi:hypothetical protein